MARRQESLTYLFVACMLAFVDVSAGDSSSYPCVGTNPCVKQFMSKIWISDAFFFPHNITEDDFKTNCTVVQSCINDQTGGGGVISDIISAAISFIYDVCSQDRQNKFNWVLQSCVLPMLIQKQGAAIQNSWLSNRDQLLSTITKSNQVKTFCSILSTYFTNLQTMLKMGGCADADAEFCMTLMQENAYEKYGGFCPCTGNCDCKSSKSTNQGPAVTKNDGGAGYMMLVFAIFFLIGAFLVKRSKSRR